MPRRVYGSSLLVLLLLSPGGRAAAPVFEKDVLPILQAKCARCHGGDKRQADLDVRSKATLLKGGDSGPALAPGAAERSLLWVQVAGDKMPPGKVKLTQPEKLALRIWIDGGALAQSAGGLAEEDHKDRLVSDSDRQFWSFRPPVRPMPPAVKDLARGINPVDRFVLAALEPKGLTLSPEADRLTLLRRLRFDLTGLPPAPAEIEAFLGDTAPGAYERLVDRLLASPHYGERWGRHWLDLAGYADSEGILDADYVRTAAWRYRDYVIRAFNADKPYDRFLQEQIAGDELTGYWDAYRTQPALGPEVVEGLIATGYLRCASDTSRPDFVNFRDAPGYYFQTLDDTVKIVGSSLLGLTVQCARCHGHKYDPIPQRDYYRLQAIFMSGYRPAQWVPQEQRKLRDATAAQEHDAARIDGVIAPLKQQLAALQAKFAQRLFADRLAALPAPIHDDVQKALATPPAMRSEVHKYLAAKFEKHLRPDAAGLPALLETAYPDYAHQSARLTAAIRAEEAKKPAFIEVRAFYDLPGQAKTHLLRRGDYLNPGAEVMPGTLAAIDAPQPFSWAAPPPESKTSGRRLALARWLTQPGHPLTGRVLVNRLWLHHFGEGIVATPDNFGHTGAAPSHPELLDWLATEFVARGWSIKAMQRLIITSATYRQCSRIDPVAHRQARLIDPDNRLLWHQRLRRLEAECLRDGMLASSGSLNPAMLGPPVPVVRQGDGEVVTPADVSGSRRSVYVLVRRSQPLTFLQSFDQPVIETNCTRRSVSTVSSQALVLLNSDFMAQQAEALAQRALREAPRAAAARALLLAFGRPATGAEQQRLDTFLESQKTRHKGPRELAMQRALADLCQMLLSANELAYVD